MSKSTDAADAIRRFAKQYELMVSAADTLEQIGSLENAQEEAKKSLDQHRKVLETEASLLAEAKAETKKVKESNLKLAEDGKTKADSVIHNATLEADRVASEAKAQADKIISNANVKAEQSLAGVKSQIDKLNTERTDLENMTASLRGEVSTLTAEAINAEVRLAKVQSAIAKLTAA
jgi:cell division septum initiation protein DivIVA